jgi:signal peptide peptidase SppA
VKFAATLRAALETPWAIERSKFAEVAAAYAERASRDDAEPRAASAAAPELLRAGTVAVIPITGPIIHRASWIEDYGWVSTETIAYQLRAAVAEPAIRTILLDVNSPGGTVAGVPELAAEIRAARDEKRVVSIANAFAASAAYWLASQAHEFWVTPSGKVGSIGVFAAHTDLSKAFEQYGATTTLISAGKFKTEGHPYGPLSEEARAAMQADVDAYYAMFTLGVARGREVTPATVRSGFGEGRMVMADQAVEQRMADRVGTRDELLARVQGKKQGPTIGARSEDDSEDVESVRDLTQALKGLTGGTR